MEIFKVAEDRVFLSQKYYFEVCKYCSNFPKILFLLLTFSSADNISDPQHPEFSKREGHFSLSNVKDM